MIRQILTYHLSFLLLVTNMGVPVFTHICHTQAKSWSSVGVPAKSCCSKKKTSSFTKPCHTPVPDQTAKVKGRPCCENENTLIILSTDFHKTSFASDGSSLRSFTYPLMSWTSHPVGIPSLHIASDISPHGPPGHVYGRSLLIFLQLFRC